MRYGVGMQMRIEATVHSAEPNAAVQWRCQVGVYQIGDGVVTSMTVAGCFHAIARQVAASFADQDWKVRQVIAGKADLGVARYPLPDHASLSSAIAVPAKSRPLTEAERADSESVKAKIAKPICHACADPAGLHCPECGADYCGDCYLGDSHDCDPKPEPKLLTVRNR